MSDTKDTEFANRLTAAHVVCGAVVIISILAAVYKLVDAVFLGGFGELSHMLFLDGTEEGNVFWIALIFLVSLVCAWLFVALLSFLIWDSYVSKRSTGVKACVLALLCLVLGNALQQGCAILLDNFVPSSGLDPLYYLIALFVISYYICFAAAYVMKWLHLLD